MALMDINTLVTNISATTTTANARIALQGATTVAVANLTSSIAYVDSGDSTVTASADSQVALNPNSVESFSINPNHTNVAAILATGTGAVQFRFSSGGE